MSTDILAYQTRCSMYEITYHTFNSFCRLYGLVSFCVLNPSCIIVLPYAFDFVHHLLTLCMCVLKYPGQSSCDTVDGRHPAPPNMYDTL